MTQPAETVRRQIVGAAVVNSLEYPTRLLVARRTAPPQFAGMWEFPGGKVEPGETCEAALLRELAEELGIGARLGPEVPGPDPQGWPLTPAAAMRVWLAEATAGEPAPLQDHDEVRWVPLHSGPELDALPWIPADRPILDALRAMTAVRAVGRG